MLRPAPHTSYKKLNQRSRIGGVEARDVKAVAADNVVDRAVFGDEGIVAVIAEHQISACTADQHVVSRITAEHVVSGATEERVGEGAAGEHVVGAAAEDDFDIGAD